MLLFVHAARRAAAHRVSALPLLVAAVCLSAAGSAEGQERRADLIGRQQAEKAAHLTKYVPSQAEKVTIRISKGLLSGPRGFYPMTGSVYSGGGMALGVGYRRFYGDNTFFDVKSLYSIKNYKWVEVSTDSLGLAQDRLSLHARAGFRDATQVSFYGVGIDSSTDGRTAFRLQNVYAGADARLNPAFPFVLTAGATYEDYETKEGQGGRPSIETKWGPADVPGFEADPIFVHTRASAAIDWRRFPGYARSGGLYEIRYHNYRDRDDVYSFNRLDGEIVQHIPLIREKYVISLRGRVETVLDEDDVVPFFLMSSLGSGSSLRGFRSWRFRDRHGLLLQAEWRWTPNRTGLDIALFYDAGKVTERRRDLDLNGLKSDFGIGVRFHGPGVTPLRVEVARGNEGLHFIFSGSAAF